MRALTGGCPVCGDRVRVVMVEEGVLVVAPHFKRVDAMCFDQRQGQFLWCEGHGKTSIVEPQEELLCSPKPGVPLLKDIER